jgi:hypothetical protein
VYPVPESDLPEPVAGDAGWLGLVTTASEDEKGAPAERVHRRSFSFLHAAPISVSGCTYDVVGVEEVTEYDVHATEPGDRRTTLAYYLPALRAGFIVAARTDGGTWVFSEPVSIEPLGAP